MTIKPKIDIDLYCLAGFGNYLVDSVLKDNRFKIRRCITRREPHHFPYWKLDSFEGMLSQLGCEVIYLSNEESWPLFEISNFAIISSFHRILPADLIKSYKLIANVHPSLLPNYRGPTPTRQMILNGEKIGGVTSHLIGKIVDEGPIVASREVEIGCLTDGQLRYQSAQMSTEVIFETLEFFLSNQQIESLHFPTGGKVFPRVNAEDWIIDSKTSLELMVRILRAFSPFPGAIVRDSDGIIRRYKILDRNSEFSQSNLFNSGIKVTSL
jgi:methionyl-tRNA formyltransferase